MKTKLFFLALVFALVFTSAKAQTTTELIASFTGYDDFHGPLDYCLADTDNDGVDDYLVTIGLTNEAGDGAIKWTNLLTGVTTHESDFPNMGGSDDTSSPLTITSTETGVFVSGYIGVNSTDAYISLRFYPFFSTTFVSSMEKIIFAANIYNLTCIDGIVYANFLGNRTYYDAMSSGYNLPFDPNGSNTQTFLVSIDPSTADMNWAWKADGGIHWLNDGESIQRAPNGNIAVQTRPSSGGSAFVEINVSDGSFVDTILDPGLDGDGDRYIFSGGYLIKYCKTNNKTFVHNATGNLEVLHETKWPQANHWNRGVDKMRIDPNGNLVFVSGYNMGILTENLIHKFVDRFSTSSYGDPKKYWINADGSIIYITQDGATTNIVKVTLHEDVSLIPVINENYSSNILSIHYGKRIDTDGNVVDGSNSEVVLGYATGTLPSGGDPAPFVSGNPANSLMNDPSGPSYVFTMYPFEEVDGTVRVRGFAMDDNNPWHNINLLAYCVKQSSLGTNVNMIEKNLVKVYPNPVKDILNIKCSEQVEHLEVYNITGQKVLEKRFTSFNTVYSLDASKLTVGTYFVKVFGEFGIISKKLIKM